MAEEAGGSKPLFAEDAMKQFKPRLAHLDFGNLFNSREYFGPLVKRALSAPPEEVKQALFGWEKQAALQRELAGKTTTGVTLANQLRTEAKNLDLLRDKVQEIRDNPKKMRAWLRQAYGEEWRAPGKDVIGLIRKKVAERKAAEKAEEKRLRMLSSKRALLERAGAPHLAADKEVMSLDWQPFVKRVAEILGPAREKERERRSAAWRARPMRIRQEMLDKAGLGHLRENPQILRMPILAFKSRVNTIAKADAQKVATAEHFDPGIHGRALYGMFGALMKKRRGRR